MKRDPPTFHGVKSDFEIEAPLSKRAPHMAVNFLTRGNNTFKSTSVYNNENFAVPFTVVAITVVGTMH